jgi:glycerophosphoryl diester phosphodiesterase
VTRIGRHGPFARAAGTVAGLLHKDEPEGPLPQPAWVIAHRGAARELPENTVAAFQRAMELGADGVETDVCVTKDGHFVLWHDADPDHKIALARQTVVPDAEGYTLRLAHIASRHRKRVCELTLEELRENYGYQLTPKDGSEGPKIPIALLEDAIVWADREPRAAHLVLDLKLKDELATEACRLLRLLAERCATLRDGLTIHFLSAHREVLEAVTDEARRISPLPGKLTLTADFEYPGVLDETRRLGLADVAIGTGNRLWPDFRREIAEVAKARRERRLRSVLAWTINDADEMRELLGFGVDGILTDDPALLRRAVAETMTVP